MTFGSLNEHKFYRPAVGAAVTVLCGLVLSLGTLGEKFTEASYDNLTRFDPRSVTNKVAVIQMTDAAAKTLTTPAIKWDRARHTEMLNKLAADHCPLVVFDVLFGDAGDNPKIDDELARAMTNHGRVVLMAGLADRSNGDADASQVELPYQKFKEAAAGWGIGLADVDDRKKEIVRWHWPYRFPPIETQPSLAAAAAQLADPILKKAPEKAWLRYYGERGGMKLIPYDQALNQPPNFFGDWIVFIGREPPDRLSDLDEQDRFQTPYTSRDKRTVGGVRLHATAFLNLLNRDWLRLMPDWLQWLTLIVLGALLGAGLSRFRGLVAVGLAVGLAVVLTSAGACLSYYTNWFFPWLIVVVGQVPCALVWALIPVKVATAVQSQPATPPTPLPEAVVTPGSARNQTIRLELPAEEVPDAPEYEIITPAVGKGGFGKVWIARNAIGQWQALKAVYQSNFGENRAPYEAEFKGLQRYKPVSEKHPGLLRIDLVSKMKQEGYFYYVMELGDAQAPGWEQQPTLYKPKDLENLRKQAYGRRLPVKECLRVVTVLADALDFLHKQGLTHRDIKPANVIFVQGRPKLADIGLVSDIRPIDEVKTFVGTFGYMPPPPEKPGTPQADIYALGMLLYVISTGSDPGLFPELSTTLMARSGQAEFIRLNAIILKACQPEVARRYQATSEMLSDLKLVAQELGLN